MIRLLKMKWTVILALLLGFWIAPIGQVWWDSVLDAYDQAKPVVQMNGTLVRQDAESVWLSISGKKLRPCTYIRLNAYGRNSSGVLVDAFARREDQPETGQTKPTGLFSIGLWRVWPKGDATAILVFSQHDCSGRIVLTKIAEVVL